MKSFELSPRPVVVIVEDEPLILLVALDVLDEAGFESIAAYNADEAIAILRARDDITAVFTDIDMPGSMDGAELAALIDQRWPAVEIMVTSGYRRPELTALPLKSSFISKPYDLESLVLQLQLIASRRKASPSGLE